MRSAILGGAGFIGLHLARRLLDDGHDVLIADDFSRGRQDAGLREVVERGAQLATVDLTDQASWQAVPRDWDEVYLLAAVVGVRNVAGDPSRVIRVNTQSVLHLLDWVQPGTRVFFSSTSEIYSGTVNVGLAEVPTAESVPLMVEDVTSPRFSYAISKLLGEAALVHATRAGGPQAVIGRFHNVYGPRMGTDHVIPEMLVRAAGGEDPFTVWGAEHTRAFCFVDDAVTAVVDLMRTPEAVGRIVHIGDDSQETTIADLAKIVMRVVGASPVLEPAESHQGSVARRCPDIHLLRTLTGYEPTVTLEEGIRRTWEWYRANGDR